MRPGRDALSPRLRRGLLRLRACLRRLRQDRLSVYAGQAAFFALLSAVPLGLLLLSLAGAVFSRAPGADWGAALTGLLPAGVRGAAGAVLAELEGRRGVPLLSATGAVLLWSASRGVRSLADGLQNIFAPEQRSSWLHRAARAFLGTLVFLGLLLAGLTAYMFLSAARSADGAAVPAALLRLAAPPAGLTALFALAYRRLAQSGLGWQQQLPGAAFSAAGWLVFSFFFSLYVRFFSRYESLYGSLGGVLLFMLWLYILLEILLLGAELNQLLRERRETPARPRTGDSADGGK